MIVGQVVRLESSFMITSPADIYMNFVLLWENCFKKLKTDIPVRG